MKVKVFSKCSNVFLNFGNSIKAQKILMVLKIISFETVVGVSINYHKNTCDRLSTCLKAVLTFQIELRDMIERSICLILMEP